MKNDLIPHPTDHDRQSRRLAAINSVALRALRDDDRAEIAWGEQ